MISARDVLSLALGKTYEGKRDVYTTLGYTKTPTFKTYYEKYKRQGLCERIINIYPDACWNGNIIISEDDDVNSNTKFELEIIKTFKRLKIISYLNKVDKLSRIGQYAILLLGVKDDRKLNEPLNHLGSLNDLVYLMPFSEGNAQIIKYEDDLSNERYGLPVTYNLRTGGSELYSGEYRSVLPVKNVMVHHSRVIHVAEDKLESEVFGKPQLEGVLNSFDNLEKVIGGGSEMFWLNGRGGINANADKDLELKNAADLSKELEKYSHQLTRIIKTKGIDVKTLNLPIHDPHNFFEVLMSTIAGSKGIPKRIFLGAERGELASSQDEINWNSNVNKRRLNHCEPEILRPLIQKLIDIGGLSGVDTFNIKWPINDSLSELDKAEVASRKSNAIKNYISVDGSDMIVPPKQFVEEILDMDYLEDDLVRAFDFDSDSD